MTRLPRVVVLLGTAFLTFATPAALASVTATAAPVPRQDSAAAIRWLQRAATAPDRISYHGTQFVTSWGPQGASSAMFDIVHAAQQGSQISVLGAGANTGVRAFVQHADTSAGPTVDGSPLSLLTDTYDLATAADAQALGRPAAVVEARRPDRTLAARFWIDKATGLLLQRHLFTVDGRQLVRATVFTDLRIDGGDFIGHLAPMLPTAAGEEVGTAHAPALRAEGWSCADRLTDSLRLYDVHRDDAGGALRFSYSDGLFNVSVFEQRGELDPAAVAGYTAVTTAAGAPVYVRHGMPSYAVWSSAGIVYTLVGDIPYDVLDRVVGAFPHEQPPSPGVVSRVGNGLARMSVWVTPVGALAARLG